MGSGGHVGTIGVGGSDASSGVTGTGGSSSGGSGGAAVVGSCTGTPEYCAMYETKAACQTVGCHWSESDFIQICETVPSPCATYTTQSSCKFAGCTWLVGVPPVVGTGGATSLGGATTNGGAIGSGGKGGLGGIVDARAAEIPASRDVSPADATDLARSDATDVPRLDATEVAPTDAGDAADADIAEVGRADVAPADAPAVKVTSLRLGPTCAHVRVGNTVQLSAWGKPSTGSEVDVSSFVSWTSDNPLIAAIDGSKVHGVGAGTVTVRAARDGVSAELSIRVVGWGPEKLEYDVILEDVGGNEQGEVIAAWRIPDKNGRVGLAYRKLDATTGVWGPATAVDTGSDGDVDHARVGTDINHDLFFLWTLHYSGTDVTELWHTSEVFDWQKARLSPASAWVEHPEIAVDRYGIAFATWCQLNADRNFDLVVRRFTPRNGWEAPVIVGTPACMGGFAMRPRAQANMMLDQDEGAQVVWQSPGGISWRAYQAEGVWAPRYFVPGSDNATLAGFNVDAQGFSKAAWLPPAGSNGIAAFTTTDFAPYQEPVSKTTVPGVTEPIDFPLMVGNGDGQNVLAWQAKTSSGWVVKAVTEKFGSGWTEPIVLGSIPGSGPQSDARIAVSPNGVASVVWKENDGIHLRRNAPGFGWSEDDLLPGTADGQDPHIHADESCNTTLVWKVAIPSTYDVWAARL